MLRKTFLVAFGLILVCATTPSLAAADPIVVTSGNTVADGDEPAFGTHLEGKGLNFTAREFAGGDLPCVGGLCLPGDSIDFSTEGTVTSFDPALVGGVTTPMAEARLVFSVAKAQLPTELSGLFSVTLLTPFTMRGESRHLTWMARRCFLALW